MSPAAPFEAGEIIAEKYRITRLVGQGGMGMVFAAVHLGLERNVAVKVLRTEGHAEDQLTRFMREARAAARLDGPHVAKVLDVGRLDSGAPYLVMELLQGQTLQALVAERGPLPLQEAVDYLLETCEALAEAHGAGIIHRDIKPGNLFLARDAYGEACIKVLDFGISKLLDTSPDPGLTDSRTMVGSPVYMSPEQMRSSRDVDHRTDIWALGAVLFELITGRVVWSGDSLSEVCVQVVRDPAPNLRRFVASAPAELEAIVARCLEKWPPRRYQHVADLAVALAKFGSDRAAPTLERVLRISGLANEHLATTAGAANPEVLTPERGTLQGASAYPPDSRARWRYGTLTALGVGALLSLVGLLVIQRPPERTRDAAANDARAAQAEASRPSAALPAAAPASASSDAATAAGGSSLHPAVRALPDAGAKSASRHRASRPVASAPPTDPMSIRK